MAGSESSEKICTARTHEPVEVEGGDVPPASASESASRREGSDEGEKKTQNRFIFVMNELQEKDREAENIAGGRNERWHCVLSDFTQQL